MPALSNITASILGLKHPDYDEFLPMWDMFESTYRGGRSWFTKHIHKYHKEGDDEFKTRVERAYRFNHAKEVVDLVGKYLFRGEINRSNDAPIEIAEFWTSSSKRGWPIDEYMPVLNRWSSVFGRIWVVVDATKIETEQASVKDVKEQGWRVFSYWVRPQDVMDCGYDSVTGELLWILIKEAYRVNESDPFAASSTIDSRYRLWDRQGWRLYEYKNKAGTKEKELQETDSGKHDLGIVPVIPLDNVTSNEDYTSASLINDIAYLDKAVANYLSNLDAIIQDQTFSQLAMPAQAAMFGEDEETTASRNRMLEVGKKRVFLYDGEGGGEPKFLSPDPKQAELIITAIKQIINEIYHSVGVAGERTKQDNSQGIDNSSGVAKAYDFERVNSLLKSKADTLERFENQLCEVVMRYHGKAVSYRGAENRIVTYPDSFDARGFNDELNVSERLELITAPLKLKQYQLKRFVNKLYPFLDAKTKGELEEAIDEMEDIQDSLMARLSKSDDDPSSNALPNEQNQDDGED